MTRALLVVAAMTMAGAAEAGQACKPGSGDPVAAMSGHQAVFAGRLTAIEAKDGAQQLSFDVLRGWKGARSGQLTVSVPAGADAYPFTQGVEYLVYARGTKGQLITDACSPSAALASVSRAVKALDLNAGYRQPLALAPSAPQGERTAGR